ncbi:hypothetical protein [Salinimicrobium xinjiangense]|uniref:hypothetical protein n=1 Tax=Salinimicrobium xinjiangense TaxID=438596 RepID=UPI0004216AF4|nr:hypothetical protein [Salinimicrobium xinjiangense]
MKLFPLFMFLFLSLGFKSYTQKVPEEFDHSKVRRYISLKHIKEREIALTKMDSSNFQYREGDTLVLISAALKMYFPDGVKVQIEPQDSLFIEKYKAAVYGARNKRDRAKQSIKVWKEGIRIHFDESVPEEHQKELIKFGKELASQIDSLNMREVSNRNEANYFVFYRNDPDDFDLDPRITDKESGYYLNWERHYFTRASLKVNTYAYAYEQQALMNLKKRFFETLGYFKSILSNSCKSFLAACGIVKELSAEDLEILKYHYSYQNCIGIGIKEFETQHEYRRKRFAEHPYIVMFVSHPKH